MTIRSNSDDRTRPVVGSVVLQQSDGEIWHAIDAEKNRQIHSIELTASENYVSRAVLEAQGSILTNKYAEGYPGRRYYGGCLHADTIENIAIERARHLFGCAYANVQPHSGSQANQAVLLTLLNPGDKILALDLKAGGHLSHGAKVNLSGRWFQALAYGVETDSQRIDMDAVENIAKRERPKLLIAGGPRIPANSITHASAPSQTKSARFSWRIWHPWPDWSPLACCHIARAVCSRHHHRDAANPARSAWWPDFDQR